MLSAKVRSVAFETLIVVKDAPTWRSSYPAPRFHATPFNSHAIIMKIQMNIE